MQKVKCVVFCPLFYFIWGGISTPYGRRENVGVNFGEKHVTTICPSTLYIFTTLIMEGCERVFCVCTRRQEVTKKEMKQINKMAE